MGLSMSAIAICTALACDIQAILNLSQTPRNLDETCVGPTFHFSDVASEMFPWDSASTLPTSLPHCDENVSGRMRSAPPSDCARIRLELENLFDLANWSTSNGPDAAAQLANKSFSPESPRKLEFARSAMGPWGCPQFIAYVGPIVFQYSWIEEECISPAPAKWSETPSLWTAPEELMILEISITIRKHWHPFPGICIDDCKHLIAEQSTVGAIIRIPQQPGPHWVHNFDNPLITVAD